jgi:pimeloyl-ACP methyl ester carboxylesterase
MRVVVDGAECFASSGGREHDRGRPLIVLLHSAGLDHSVWALLARWFAHRGWNVVAPDLPGHGRSGGEALGSVAAMADWTAKLIDACGAARAVLVGHSMGSLIALETAARHGEAVDAIVLIGTAAAMPVTRELLAAAAANDQTAIDMMSVWGYGRRAVIGGSLAPGLWMLGGGRRLLERARPGVLFRDLTACNEYSDGLAAAGRVKVPALLVLGERDLMTPARRGMELADALAHARVVTHKGAGHMLMSERPDEVLNALGEFARERFALAA